MTSIKMKTIKTQMLLRTIYVVFALVSSITFAQNTNLEYNNLIRDGWKLCLEKNFIESAKLYEKAFKLNNKVPLSDRYNASCIYALSGNKDMAFHYLFITANDLKWDDYNHLINDSDLKVLHSDKRWEELKAVVLKNKQEVEAHFDKDLVAVLDKIYFDDQSTRNQIRSMEEKYGRNSKEMDAFWQTILKKDSINLIKVSKILDERGWPSKALIGKRGTSTLFLVIQHANQEAQEKYLPLIEKAVADNNLPKQQYAMFYDRLLLRRGERQVYGTQLAINNESKTPYVLPLEDPINVDTRRLEMGLNTMQENLNRWSLTWDAEAYLKERPAIEAKEKELNSKNNKND
ncbi:DUF6624 domain-containing protein [Hwangdonia lutea]|uniref:DUF6624 domain-containing protein n=1 Tax=Hwangdonia lutea TaxID=3075823 RepID=A0AA97ELK7_9FLAO|nr:DUF6624 domain-containing protein [Hwangdonia sp. SCSIO 19198]WOD43221.1 DUF6624 domain-containing protein [Hwangdonia sp. SCSIO 19198]